MQRLEKVEKTTIDIIYLDTDDIMGILDCDCYDKDYEIDRTNMWNHSIKNIKLLGFTKGVKTVTVEEAKTKIITYLVDKRIIKANDINSYKNIDFVTYIEKGEPDLDGNRGTEWKVNAKVTISNSQDIDTRVIELDLF